MTFVSCLDEMISTLNPSETNPIAINPITWKPVVDLQCKSVEWPPYDWYIDR